ncbi:MAG: ribosome biogenesis/translation initiation ATPase RLI [archaeon]
MTKRIAIVRLEKCKAPKDCPYLCIRACPPVRAGKQTIIENKETGKIIIEEETCIGCGLCVKKCPFDAITIINLPEALAEPIHRFGKNSFALYGRTLPFPEKGAVTGFLGPNGCGKTTVVSILSGSLIPNLNSQEEGRLPAVIEHFAGQEIQKHFKVLEKGSLRAAVKPQQISVSGRIGETLVSEAAAKVPEETLREFNIRPLFGRKISELSGGELQRLTIALAYGKDADLYFFDEPSSFLDIRERIRTAKRLRNLAGTGKSVFLVEHDLTLLDTASDNVILFYGEPSVYGVVSIPKTQRVGINTYLSGFSRDENIRFRPGEIKFSERAPVEKMSRKEAVQEFSKIEKKLGEFSLFVEGGKIRKGEVVGVVGENGTGKTTFVRILAGEMKPDRGDVKKQLMKLSYKPQQLEVADRELAVRQYLAVPIAEASDLNFESEVAEPLSLRLLMQKKLGELSGGELQRVVIAAAMMKKADLYLLDEPSAFLDVEQRLEVAKFIKRVNEKRGAGVLVVDHDVLFIDYLADSLVVFSGTPAVSAKAVGPLTMREGMNLFLSDLGVTFRRDPDTKRPRANKEDSRLDREQKGTGEYYFSG